MKLNTAEFGYFGICLEGFFYGIYSGIFAMYLQYHGSKGDANKGNNILFYALCLLYILSVATFASDVSGIWVSMNGNLTPSRLNIIYLLDVIQTIVFACGDSIAQFILIYRCWIVWGHNIRVVIVPLIVAFAFLATWIAGGVSPVYFVQGQVLTPGWSPVLTMTGLAMSMAVNALVMSLIVFRIFKVFREVKQALGATGGSTLRPIIFVLIESGMLLFSIQLVRLVVGSFMTWTDNVGAYNAYASIACIHEMLNGITPTIILVRVSMGFSFHDENSMVEAAGSLHFAPADDLNPILDAGGSGIDYGLQLAGIELGSDD